MQKTSVGGNSFAKAMEIMKNLKSSALTDAQTTTLEQAYQDSKARIILLEGTNGTSGFVGADKDAIKALIANSENFGMV
jgi:hypothetical protein